MPQSYAAIYNHIVFSTKEREPLIKKDFRDRLHQFMGGLCRNRKCVLLSAGGIPDHMHLLVSFSREISMADFVRDIKSDSSDWAHDEKICPDLYWQNGYAAFSVSHSNLGAVTKYIENQEEHHKKRTFQEELVELLRKHNIEFDERYLWQ